jgi:hypothetical protein
LIDDSIDFKI